MRSLGTIPAMWIVWALYWAYASRGVPPDRSRESRGSRFVHTPPLIVAFAAFALARRVRAEETVLRRQFGSRDACYAARVAAMLPVPRRRGR